MDLKNNQEHCDGCLNGRPIVSENGIHRICCLTTRQAVECMSGKKNHSIRIGELFNKTTVVAEV